MSALDGIAFVRIDDDMPAWVRVDAITAVYADADGRTHVAYANDEIVVDKMADEVIELMHVAMRRAGGES